MISKRILVPRLTWRTLLAHQAESHGAYWAWKSAQPWQTLCAFWFCGSTNNAWQPSEYEHSEHDQTGRTEECVRLCVGRSDDLDCGRDHQHWGNRCGIQRRRTAGGMVHILDCGTVDGHA